MGTQRQEVRLDKYLADMNMGSRKDVRQAARKGQITLNGSVCRDAGQKVRPGKDEVCLDGKPVSYHKYEYYMLNKPAGVVSAVKDNLYPTVAGLVDKKIRQDLFPVGRLDVDTEGLILLTNDGPLAHELLSPKKHVDKVYYAKVSGRLPENGVRLFQEGLLLKDGTKVLPADLVILNETDSHLEIKLTLREGKFHQVKRMFEAVDCRVVYLKRIAMGSLRLDPGLSPGAYRALTKEEVAGLKAGGR